MLQKLQYKYFHKPPKLHVALEKGWGEPVLLIHGLATSGETWQPLYSKLLPDKWRVIVFDLLGFGRSPKPDYIEYSVEDHAKAVLKTLSWKNKRKPLTIIGHSMGCLVASHIAATRPKLVKHLILYQPPLFADSPEFRSHKRRKDFYFAFYSQLLKRPQLLFSYGKLINRIGSSRAPSVEPETWLPFEKSLKNTIIRQKAYNELKQITVPTDIIYGRYDFVVTRKKVKDMLKANRNITFHMVNEMHDITPKSATYILKLLRATTNRY